MHFSYELYFSLEEESANSSSCFASGRGYCFKSYGYISDIENNSLNACIVKTIAFVLFVFVYRSNTIFREIPSSARDCVSRRSDTISATYSECQSNCHLHGVLSEIEIDVCYAILCYNLM